MSNKERSDKDVTNIEEKVKLEEISERFNNETETIEDMINYCRNYEIKFENNITIRVIEKKYFDKLVKRIQELEEENAILKDEKKLTEDVEMKDITQVINKTFEEFMKDYIPTQKVKDIVKEAIEIIESEQFKIIMGDMTKVGRLKYLLTEELLEGEK